MDTNKGDVYGAMNDALDTVKQTQQPLKSVKIKIKFKDKNKGAAGYAVKKGLV